MTVSAVGSVTVIAYESIWFTAEVCCGDSSGDVVSVASFGVADHCAHV